MKRMVCVVLLALLLSLTGCGSLRSGFKAPVNFYYPRYEQDYQYGKEDSVIVSETREASGHMGQIDYLLSVYLAGALDETLSSPFPSGTKLMSVKLEQGTLIVELSSTAAALNDPDFSLGCTCLTLTCLELTDASEVTVLSGERILTLGYDSLTLYDDVLVEPEE